MYSSDFIALTKTILTVLNGTGTLKSFFAYSPNDEFLKGGVVDLFKFFIQSSRDRVPSMSICSIGTAIASYAVISKIRLGYHPSGPCYKANVVRL